MVHSEKKSGIDEWYKRQFPETIELLNEEKQTAKFYLINRIFNKNLLIRLSQKRKKIQKK